jgi:hypothetical protein
LRVVLGVEAVPGTGETPDDGLDVAACPPCHLVADKLGLFPQAGLPDRVAELAQFVPDLVALTRTVTAEPVRRRHHTGILPHRDVRRTGGCPLMLIVLASEAIND